LRPSSSKASLKQRSETNTTHNGKCQNFHKKQMLKHKAGAAHFRHVRSQLVQVRFIFITDDLAAGEATHRNDHVVRQSTLGEGAYAI
jgi:hypothetical protein